MTQEEFTTAIHDTVYLAGCAVKEEIPDQRRVQSMNLDNLYLISNSHLLAAAVGMALESAGVRTSDFTQAIAKSKRKTALLNADRSAVLDKLEHAGIWYMPLKGSVLQADYPKMGMRQMADNDILINPDRASEVKTIMTDLGFSVKSVGTGNHDIYYKQPVSNFEIHRQLFGLTQGDKIYPYFLQVMNRILPDEGTQYGRHFSLEDFYLYLIAHEHKHFSASGTGLRSLLDVYVYLKKHGNALNWVLIEQETEKMGLSPFEQQNRSLTLHLFDGLPLTKLEEEMFNYMASSGTYGNVQNRVNKRIREMGGGKLGKTKYFFWRLVLPMDVIQAAYPFFYQHKILLPFFAVFRLLRALIFSRDRIRAEIRAIKHFR